ncbi:Uncharacterized protein APZ42_003474, partial [Daphnia magna]
MGVVQTRVKKFGNVIEARWERYRVAEDEVLYPVLATWMIYDGEKPTCRLCDDETHFSYNCPTLKRNQEPTIVPKPVPKMTKKTETIKQNPLVIPLAKHSMVSKVPLEGELQDSPLGGTQNLETETMECDTLTSSLTVPSKDNPSKPIKKSQMTAPDTETQAQEPMTIIMESMEPDMGEIETMEPDKTKDPLRIPTQMTLRLKIASINNGGIRSVERRQILLNFCRDGNLDIVRLQEVAFHSCPIIEGCYHLLANVGPNRNGTAILIKNGLEYSRLLLEPDGRLIAIAVKCFTFINIYAPSGKQSKNERNTFLRQTVPAYSVTTRLPFVLMGDFNCVDDIQDRANTQSLPIPSNVVSYALMEMVTGLNLVYIWKALKHSEPGHTFHYHSGSSRLDRIYASRSFADKFLNISFQSLSISDQQSVQSTFTCNLDLPNRSRFSAGLWKLNTLILSEEGYQKYVINFIQESANHPLRESNVANWWESVLKPGIKRNSVDYSRQRARLIRETKFLYQSCIQEMAEADT